MPLRSVGSELVRWGALSLVSFGANLGLTILFREWVGLPAPAAFAIALFLVFVGNFIGLRYFVFDIADGPPGVQAGRFGALTLLFRSGEWVVFSILHLLGAADYRVLVVIVLAISSVVKFVIYRVVLLPTGSPKSPPEA